jgi:hypothetical protein
MKRFNFASRLFLLLALPVGPPVLAEDDTAVLTSMLQHFLANADKREVHEAFWSDDLIYSSSSGLRFGKADIMQGFDSAAAADDDAPAVNYSGEEIDIHLYDDVAVVAFKLVGTPVDGSAKLYYYNTGTFLKRDGAWRAVAWQATVIPPAEGG